MGTVPLWIGFNVFVLIALALDLGVFHRKAHKIATGEAALWTALWVGLSILFGWGIWHF
jgi:tellurite resistance protein TerC